MNFTENIEVEPQVESTEIENVDAAIDNNPIEPVASSDQEFEDYVEALPEVEEDEVENDEDEIENEEDDDEVEGSGDEDEDEDEEEVEEDNDDTW